MLTEDAGYHALRAAVDYAEREEFGGRGYSLSIWQADGLETTVRFVAFVSPSCVAARGTGAEPRMIWINPAQVTSVSLVWDKPA